MVPRSYESSGFYLKKSILFFSPKLWISVLLSYSSQCKNQCFGVHKPSALYVEKETSTGQDVGASMRGRILTSMCNDTQVVKVERLSVYSKRITGSHGDGRRVSRNIVMSPRKS